MRNPINKLFLEHPASVGESYFQHLLMASGFAGRMLLGSIACLLHGLFPFMCTKTGSGVINDLHTSMVTHRSDKKNSSSSAHKSQLSNDSTQNRA